MAIIGIVHKINRKRKKTDFFEASIWYISIVSMQGSPWSPKTCSGKILLVTALFFALLIYNSYAGVITSILSVEVQSIDSIEDLLESDYDIGYTKDTLDETLLRVKRLIGQFKN